MRTLVLVVLDELAQDLLEMAVPQDEEMVEQLAPDRAHPALGKGVGVRGSWLADMLVRLAVRYPEVPIVCAGSRRFAEEWAYCFFGPLCAIPPGRLGPPGSPSLPPLILCAK